MNFLMTLLLFSQVQVTEKVDMPKYLLKTDNLLPNSYMAVYLTQSKPGPYPPYKVTEKQFYSTSPPSIFTTHAPNLYELILGRYNAVRRLKIKNRQNKDSIILIKLIIDQHSYVAMSAYYVSKESLLDLVSNELQEVVGLDANLATLPSPIQRLRREDIKSKEDIYAESIIKWSDANYETNKER